MRKAFSWVVIACLMSQSLVLPVHAASTASEPSGAPKHVIQAGDLLYFSVSPAEELSREAAVDENGKISIPLIGAIPASGRTAEELARLAAQKLSQFVTNPKVYVFVKQSSSMQVSLMGQVRAPGIFHYRSNLRLLDAVSMAGGFLPSADKRRIRVSRGSGTTRRVVQVDVEPAMASRDTSKDFLLEPGDLVEVPRGAAHAVTIFGEVQLGGTFDYVSEMRLLDLISLSQGFKEGADFNDIRVFRGEAPRQKAFRVRFSKVFKGRMDYNIPIQPGDIVYVPKQTLWKGSAWVNILMPFATMALTASTVVLAIKK